MIEKILVLIAVGFLACIPVAFGIRNYVEARSMAVTEADNDSDQLQAAIDQAFYVANYNHFTRTNAAVVVSSE